MGKLAKIKTIENSGSVTDFISNLPDEQKRKDSQVLLKIMEELTNETPKMWGSSMIGFGNVRYKSPATGREVDWFRIGFSPRKSNLSLHLVLDISRYAEVLKKLGKHKTGVGCLYINRLDDINLEILKDIIEAAVTKESGKSNQEK
jgi:hypothetical protein